jgi:hypothetical protein
MRLLKDLPDGKVSILRRLCPGQAVEIIVWIVSEEKRTLCVGWWGGVEPWPDNIFKCYDLVLMV